MQPLDKSLIKYQQKEKDIQMKPALIIGSTCVDVILNLDHLPVTEEDLHPHSQSMSIGGCAYNVSNMLRLLHAPHTFITPIAGGIYGDYVYKHFTRNQIPVNVYLPEKENGCCYCLVEATGERTFLSCHGAEYTFQEEWMERFSADEHYLTYVCGLEIEEATGENLISYLEKHPQLEVCYAPGPRGCLVPEDRTKRIFALHPILHINELESLQLSGRSNMVDAARALQEITKNTVIITLGARGAYCLEKGKTGYVVPSVKAEKKADTIGAGDAHIGTILACLTNGMELRESIAYANKVCAKVISVHGGTLPPEMLPEL